MSLPTDTFPQAGVPEPGYYTPGHSRRKLAMILYGVVLFACGMWQLWTPLRLTITGVHVQAEASAVIKSKEGLPDVVLADDLQVKAKLEPHDRSYIFWNQFRFHTRQGKLIEVRAPVGGRHKPIYNLSDADGLPTTDRVCYDPSKPEVVVFPYIVSTWFGPVAMLAAGMLCMVIGSTLLYWANKPIELPHLSQESKEPKG
jgi:hypothetical protein